MRNTISKLYKAVSAPVAATRDALAERLQSVRDAPSLLHNRMIQNMGYEQEGLKGIVEKEAKKEVKEQQQKPAATKEEEEAKEKEEEPAAPKE